MHAGHSLDDCNTSSGITLQIFTVSHFNLDGDVVETGLTLDPLQNIIVRTRGLVCIGQRWCNPQPPSSRWRIYLKGSFYEIHPTSARRRSSPCGTFGPPTKKMVTLASSSLDVTHEIKEKTLGRSLPGRPRERGLSLQGMIAPLVMRMKRTQGMKSPWRMKLGQTWGHSPRVRAIQPT